MAEQTILDSNALTNSNNRNNELRKRIILERRKSFPDQLETIQHFTQHQQSCLHDIEEVSLCVCQQSKNFPLCDKTHTLFDLNIQPLVVGVPKQLFHSSISTKKPISRSQNCVDTHITSSCGNHCSTCSENDVCTKVEKDSQITSPQNQKNIANTNKCSEQSVESQTNPSAKNDHHDLADLKPVDSKVNPQTYSMKEVSQHCTKDDCWIVFYDKVYDVTPYFGFHPGGERALLKFAGKDGTENVEFHSKQMMILLDKYFFVGHLRKEDVTHPPPSQCIII